MKKKTVLKYLAPLCAAILLTACGGGGGSSSDAGSGSASSYTVTAGAGSGGVITPDVVDVPTGETTTLSVTPDNGYAIASVTGCDGTLAGDTYTTGPISGDCTVSATFGVTYSVGGEVSGLVSGGSVTLENNSGDDLTVSANGGFTFTQKVVDGGDYNVTVAAQPTGQECTVSAGSGIVNGADVTGVAVSCKILPPAAPTVTLGYGIKALQFSWEAVPGATYYQLEENPDGVSGYSVVADNVTATAVSHEITLYNRINAHYMVNACNDAGCTASTEIMMSNQLADAIGYFKSSDPDEYDFFDSVSLSADGTTLAVGAEGEDSSASGINGDDSDNSLSYSGAVYVFVRSGTDWIQQAYIKPSNPAVGQTFGVSVSLSADGNTLAVGSWNSSREVYVFNRSGSTWSQQTSITTTSVEESDSFGARVKLSGDGLTLAVSAFHDSSADTGVNSVDSGTIAASSGAVYVFVRSGSSWSQQAYIKASNTDAYDNFGIAIDLSYSGKTLVVGAHQEDSASTGVDGAQGDNSATDSGAVYVFTRSNTTWTQQAYLKASNTGGDDLFGYAVSLSADGNTLAVGAYGESSSATGVGGNQADNSALQSGAVYVYARTSTSWYQLAYIKASNTGENDWFGRSVTLSADGTTMAVGARYEGSSAIGINGNEADNSALNSGAAYLFTRSGSNWSQQAYLKALNTGTGDSFGEGISLSGDGNTLAVAAPYEASSATGVGGNDADNSTTRSGAVYLY